jgi:hypothetical protein
VVRRGIAISRWCLGSKFAHILWLYSILNTPSVTPQKDLLISRDKLKDMPFLNACRTDVDIDVSALSASSRRAYINEERVKGKGKAIIRVDLADSSGLVLDSLTNRLQARWVIRKRVPTKDIQKYLERKDSTSSVHLVSPIFAEKEGAAENEVEKRPRKDRESQTNKRQKLADSKPKYSGDGNDTASQQEANWRWQSSRFDVCSTIKKLAMPFGFYSCMLSNFVGEVVRVTPEPSTSRSLAMVTVRRLILPEQTATGRMSHHSPNETYADLDATTLSTGQADEEQRREALTHYRIPVEELLIISKRVDHISKPGPKEVVPRNGLVLTQEYSARLNLLLDSSLVKTTSRNINGISQLCCRCRKALWGDAMESVKVRTACSDCINAMKHVFPDGLDLNSDLTSVCDCHECRKKADLIQRRLLFHNAMTAARKIHSYSPARLQEECPGRSSEFIHTRNILKHLHVKPEFGMTQDFLTPNLPASKPIVRVKRKGSKKHQSGKPLKSVDGIIGDSVGKLSLEQELVVHRTEQDFEMCSRLFPYDRKSRSFEVSEMQLTSGKHQEHPGFRDRERNFRLLSGDKASHTGGKEKDEKSINSRALRANQRRLLRDVAAIGVSVDTLAGRTLAGHERHLRFDRSKIHAWGVFADKDIKENEMLVEYRGEIIGNCMCEKREKEYEDAKIGSDYMFRIDGLSVCDATKQGNVARFINHSCDPNCFTKIISIEGNGRIVIYAKRDIGAGEELSYDYKFPLEYDEKKRIPCHCGSRDCRGFMNWVSSIDYHFILFSFLTSFLRYSSFIQSLLLTNALQDKRYVTGSPTLAIS